MKQICLLTALFLFLSATLSNAIIVINGDVTDGITTFSFPIRAFTTNFDGSMAFIGANEPGHKEYALCRLAQGETVVQPIASEKIRVNNLANSMLNPLYNGTISMLGFMNQEERTVVITQEMPAYIFVLDKIINPDNNIMFSRLVMDASGTQSTSGTVALGVETSAFIFAAVKDNAGNPFGQTGSNSGIAVLWRVNIVTGKGENTQVGQGVLEQLDAQPGAAPTADARRAALFDGTIPAIKIGADNATILNGAANLFVNNLLKILYIGTQARAGAGGADGVRSVVASSVINNKLIYKSIAPDSAFSAGTDNIIGTIGANAIASNFKTLTMDTSTNLLYLIILGGIEGGAASTRRTIYSLPLVLKIGSDTNGTLAKKDALPVTHCESDYPQRFSWRAFEDAATTPADMFTAVDPQVTVGNGPLAAGDITDIFVKNDAVFAVVSTPTTGYSSGIFYSRALFDEFGRIKAWTNWQRAFGSVTDSIFGAFVSFDTAACTYLTGTSSSTINTIKRTTWGSGNTGGMNPLATFVQKTFAIADGGMRGMDEFPAATPSLDGISLVVGCGAQKILMAQTAYTSGGVLTPLVGTTLAVNPLSYTAGTITDDFPVGNTNAIAISGGALANLKPIVTSAIGQAGAAFRAPNGGWLFVGGIGGLAVLADEDGAGWGLLGDKFTGLRAGMSFKTIGNYSFIRKLMADNGYLYVLSDSTLDRINLEASDFATGDLAVTTVATAEKLSVKSLVDFVVSDSFVLLGTTNGLFTLSNNGNIQTVNSNAEWEAVDLPEGLACISQIYPISQTLLPQDVARYQGGNIYVLDTDPGKNRSMVHRFSLTVTGTSTKFAMLPDQFIENYPSYFVEFEGMRNWIMPDGDFLYEGRDRTYHNDPLVFIASQRLRSGVRLEGNTNPLIYGTTQGEFFVPMIRNSATGTLLLPTDQGLTAYE